MNRTTQIDLSRHNTQGVRVFAGRDKGIAVAKELDVEHLPDSYETVEVLIPADIISINVSFFLGLFGPTIRKLKEEEFRKIFQFKAPPEVETDIESGIEYALKRSNALPK